MQKLAADNCGPAGSFGSWRELRSRDLFGTAAAPPEEAYEAFPGEVTVAAIGAATLIDVRASAYRVQRNHNDVSGPPGESLCVYQQSSGCSRFDPRRGGAFIASPGAMALSYRDHPAIAAQPAGASFRLRIIRVPVTDSDSFAVGAGEAATERLETQSGLGALLSTYFSGLVAQGPHLAPGQADLAIRTLASLALASRGPGLAARRRDASRHALRSGLLRAAQDLIERHIARPDLSPAAVAAKLGVSLRQLHYLFEPTGTSFSRYVTLRRLDHARRLLQRIPEHSIADVAFASGFESSATFHRLFRSAHGMSPGDFRRSSGSLATAAPV